MTTPSREEAPEHVWLDPMGASTWILRHGPGAETVEYLRADLANREPSEGDVERVCRVLAADDFPLMSENWIEDNWPDWKPVARKAINAYRGQP